MNQRMEADIARANELLNSARLLRPPACPPAPPSSSAQAPTHPNGFSPTSDLAKMVDTSDEWIRARSGIRERRIAAAGRGDLRPGGGRGRRARSRTRASAPREIDLLIVATVTPDFPMPATACLVQHKLGRPVDGGLLRPERRLLGLHLRPGHRLRHGRLGPLPQGPGDRRGEALVRRRLEGPRAPAFSSATGPARPSSAPATGPGSG